MAAGNGENSGGGIWRQAPLAAAKWQKAMAWRNGSGGIKRCREKRHRRQNNGSMAAASKWHQHGIVA
jgi:hypothetical protein